MKKKALAIVMAALVGMTLLAGCGGNSAKSSGTNEIVVALIANTTGDYAQYGIPVRNAAMMYFDKVNANGGINGKKITVLEYDDKADGVESKNAFNLAMEKHISAVLGSVLTGATIALADATYEAGVPQVTASATAEGVTVIDPDDPASGIRDNVFRSCFIDPFQGEKMADYAVNKLGAKTAAIFYETGSDYSEGVKAAFESTAARLGLQIVAA
ncbi:MAG: ABC transporter substrate-binding protein, partial [Clostridia bacterium]|nr:ABC transporter substrate-binding protein [Clostridia bacterium]